MSPREAPTVHRSPIHGAHHSSQQLYTARGRADGRHGEANPARNNILSGKYTVLAVCQIIHCASGLSFLTAVCLIRQRFISSGLSSSVALVMEENLSEDIQCVGSDTRPPMLDRTDFASWQQRPFQMGTFRETLAEENEGALHLGPEQARVYSDLSPEDKERYNADIQATNILLQGLPKDIYTLINHYTDAKYIWVNVKMLLEGETIHDYYARFTKLINDMRNIKMTMPRMQLNLKFVNNMLPEWGRFVTLMGRQNRGQGNNARGTSAAGYGGAQNRVGNANPSQARQIKCYNYNGIGHIARNCTHLKRPQNSEYFKDKMLMMQAQENGVALDEEQFLFIAGGQDKAIDEDVDEQPIQDLALNVDNMFQADDYDAFDSDVDEAPTAHTMFKANLSSTDPVYDEAGPSYDLDILSEVHDHDHYQDAVCEHHEAHEMHHVVQPNCVVDSNANYTSDSNMITYDQHVKDNAKPAVQSNVSSVPNDAYMMIINEMHEQSVQSVSANKQNKVLNASLTAKLDTYKEQVELYERRAKFELTEREQKIEEQLRIVITNRNIKEENLKKELHSVKMKLSSTINHNKLMVEEVMSLKKDFKQKENKYLEEFLDMKALKGKVEDKLYKQDQSLQIVHMLCKPKPYYDEQKRKHDEIEWKNLLIANNNLIAYCLSKEVFYIATNSELTVSRFTEMHDAHTVVQARCLELEAKLSKLRDKVQKDDHTKLVKCFSNLEVNHLNLQLKYQNLKEIFGNNTSLPARDAPNFDSIFVIGKMKASIQGKDNAIKKLRMQISQLKETRSEVDCTLDFRALDFQITQLTEKITITRAKHIEQTTALLTENENLKAQIHENLKSITKDSVKPRVLAPGRYAIDVEPIPPPNRNNREVHLDYLKHLKESVETLREIVEEAKVERPLDRSLASACLYTKHSQELLEYVIGTCPKDFNKQDKKHASTPLTRKKQVIYKDQYEKSNNNTHKHVEQLNIQKTNVPVLPSTGVNSCTDASGLQPRSNTKKNRISSAKSVNKKKVEEHHRTNKSSLKTTNHVDSSISS
ncbi:retrovirus-related pol polyprotein from transposon TNT 1-94 [Tanacetum coccineum]